MTEYTTVKIPTALLDWAHKNTPWCGWSSNAELVRNAIRFYVDQFSKNQAKKKK